MSSSRQLISFQNLKSKKLTKARHLKYRLQLLSKVKLTNSNQLFSLSCKLTNSNLFFSLSCELSNSYQLFSLSCELTNSNQFFSLSCARYLADAIGTSCVFYSYQLYLNKYIICVIVLYAYNAHAHLNYNAKNQNILGIDSVF